MRASMSCSRSSMISARNVGDTLRPERSSEISMPSSLSRYSARAIGSRSVRYACVSCEVASAFFTRVAPSACACRSG
jgi:hypothetical protein